MFKLTSDPESLLNRDPHEPICRTLLMRKKRQTWRTTCAVFRGVQALLAGSSAIILFPALAAGEGTLTQQETRQICVPSAESRGVTLTGRAEWLDDAALRDTETRLVCGDPSSAAWSAIPPAQAEMFLRMFLQERGFHGPVFQSNGGHLHVVLGAPSVLTDLRITGSPRPLPRNRLVHGERLTPALLNGLENWVKSQLDLAGVPCATAQATAETASGRVTILVTAPSKTAWPAIRAIRVRPPGGLDASTLASPFAVQPLGLYSGAARTISERRAQEEFGLLNSYFLVQCHTDAVELEHRSTLGLRRSFLFGVGFDTEGLLQARARYEDKRLNSEADRLQVEARASFLQQSLRAELLVRPGGEQDTPTRENDAVVLMRRSSHLIWKTAAEVAHTATSRARYIQLKGQTGPQIPVNFTRHTLTTETLPTFAVERKIRGIGAEESLGLWLEAQAVVQSNDHAYFLTQPTRGHLIGGHLRVADSRLLSTFSATGARLWGQWLGDPGFADPPLLVCGLRGSAAVTFPGARNSGARADQAAELPPSWLHYLGGSDNLRGFRLQELPRDGAALGVATISAEARHVLVPWTWAQPLVFVDAGVLSQTGVSMPDEIFWSPGLGVRFQTPFGAVRGAAAYGFSTARGDTRPQHPQLYLSIGEEF